MRRVFRPGGIAKPIAVAGASPSSSPAPTLGGAAPQTTAARRHKSYVLKFVRGHLPSDLKDVQGAIGCLYGELPDADEYGAFKMPFSYLQSYRQLGYTVMPHAVLSPEQVDVLSDEASQLADDVEHHPKSELLYATSLNSVKEGPLFYCQGQWRCCWGMHDLVYMPQLAVPSSQLLGNLPVRLWYDEVILKAGRVGPCLPWQQSYQRWQHTRPLQHVTVVVALETMTAQKGALCVVPGSHMWRGGEELLPPVPFDPAADEAAAMGTIWDLVNEDERECLSDTPPVTVELKRGQAMFVHPMLLHSTHANISLDRSKCVLIHYMAAHTQTTQPGCLLPKTTRFPADTIIQGPYFPITFDPAIVDDFGEPHQSGERAQLDT